MAVVTIPQNTSLFSSPERSTELTVTFSEDAKGWTCFKSFIQDNGFSLNNDYYTLKDGELWKHHVEVIDPVTGLETNRNTFYGSHVFSHVDVLFNEESATVKTFGSMKYEGSQAKITQNLGSVVNGVNYSDNEYYNNEAEDGWYVEYGTTDLQLAGEMEFKDKEGKWFSYMKGVPVKSVDNLNSKEFSFQGIDLLDSIVYNGNGEGEEGDIYGCVDPAALNYNPNATIDDGSCTYAPPVTYGCTDPLAVNYDPSATSDDGSCIYCVYGCTDPTATNYDASATCDDGSCIPCVYGCTDATASNYDPAATCDDGSCIPIIYGCTDPLAINYYPGATMDDGSCIVCSTLSIDYTITSHPMSNLSNGIKVLLHNTGDDLPYTVACLDSSGTTIGDSSGAFGWSSGGTTSQGDIVYFGQGVPLITDTYTIIITTASGCTSQDTIFIDNGASSSSSQTFTITVHDLGDED